MSQFGDWFNQVACLTMLHEVNNDGMALSMYFTIRLIPFVLFGFINGVVADTFDKKKIMVGCFGCF